MTDTLVLLTIIIYIQVITFFINHYFNHKQNKKVMSKVDDLQAALDNLQANLDQKQAEIIAEIQSLKGTQVTDEQLDALIAKVGSINTDLTTTDLG